MKTVLVTGYNGFIGKNLIERLEGLNDVNILKFGKKESLDYLRECIKKSDFIYHLAGVNRTKDDSDFIKSNVDLTQSIVDIIKDEKKYIPILISSSIQSDLDNPYGVSKKKAEEILLKYKQEFNVDVFIYKLPNVFGKWSRPKYNSVVATFCYNLSRNLDITIFDPSRQLELAYIDDVVDSFLLHLQDENIKENSSIPSYNITLQKLADILYEIKKGVNGLIIPNLKDKLIKSLHATYLSFLDENQLSCKLKENKDKRGSFVELIKSDYFGQISVSKTKEKLIRGNHYHNTKNEKFCVVQGSALIKFRNFYSDEITKYYVSGDKMEIINIPPGYTHSIENIGDDELILLIWANEIFDEKNQDTYYCEVDDEKTKSSYNSRN